MFRAILLLVALLGCAPSSPPASAVELPPLGPQHVMPDGSTVAVALSLGPIVEQDAVAQLMSWTLAYPLPGCIYTVTPEVIARHWGHVQSTRSWPGQKENRVWLSFTDQIEDPLFEIPRQFYGLNDYAKLPEDDAARRAKFGLPADLPPPK